MSQRESFPLAWPDGWARTPAYDRTRSRFDSPSFRKALDGIHHQLGMIGGANVVITSNLPLKRNGQPYATAHADDPGIAVYWVKDGREHTMACDRWLGINENMHAIDLALNAIRGLDRWGAGEVATRAFAGFAALPPGDATAPGAPQVPRKRHWRSVLGGMWPRELGPVELLAIAKARHRELIRTAHPDAGGDHDVTVELNVALAEAEAELTK